MKRANAEPRLPPALPRELLCLIIAKMDTRSVALSCFMVCREWRAATATVLWQTPPAARPVIFGHHYAKWEPLLGELTTADSAYMYARRKYTIDEAAAFTYRSALLLALAPPDATWRAVYAPLVARDPLLNGRLDAIAVHCTQATVPAWYAAHVAHLQRCAAHQARIAEQRATNVLVGRV